MRVTFLRSGSTLKLKYETSGDYFSNFNCAFINILSKVKKKNKSRVCQRVFLICPTGIAVCDADLNIEMRCVIKTFSGLSKRTPEIVKLLKA